MSVSISVSVHVPVFMFVSVFVPVSVSVSFSVPFSSSFALSLSLSLSHAVCVWSYIFMCMCVCVSIIFAEITSILLSTMQKKAHVDMSKIQKMGGFLQEENSAYQGLRRDRRNPEGTYKNSSGLHTYHTHMCVQTHIHTYTQT